MMYNFESNTGLFAVCIVLMLTTITKWYNLVHLDELPEYKRSVLEVMRQPLEDRKITVSRAKMGVEYPAGFMLVAAMNPCPCGHWGDPTHACTCTPAAVHRYLSRISGPLLDRIDLQEAFSYRELDKEEQWL